MAFFELVRRWWQRCCVVLGQFLVKQLLNNATSGRGDPPLCTRGRARWLPGVRVCKFSKLQVFGRSSCFTCGHKSGWWWALARLGVLLPLVPPREGQHPKPRALGQEPNHTGLRYRSFLPRCQRQGCLRLMCLLTFLTVASVPRAGGSVTSVIIPALFCFFWQLVFFHLVKSGSRGCFKDKFWLVLLKIQRDIYIFCLYTIDTKITCTLIFVYWFFVCLIGSQTYNISSSRSCRGLLRFLFGYMSWVAIIH